MAAEEEQGRKEREREIVERARKGERERLQREIGKTRESFGQEEKEKEREKGRKRGRKKKKPEEGEPVENLKDQKGK